ncbi:facilitated trehalose transporter Tret1-2 homolog [Schistocerca serialis cubense]|uniref:facilitated trehalose transporter Tret1-2 homolog n=1 Tax=Schistocerca serialis cubense TaxID=2023355 RepID=UPI00214F2AC7|nr:facilitated trehalose transporter Tret1-2 homolog [Schistocerca serialis cubense]
MNPQTGVSTVSNGYEKIPELFSGINHEASGSVERRVKQHEGERCVTSPIAARQDVNIEGATLAFLTSGLFIGFSSPMIPRLQQNTSHIVISADEGSWMASVGMITTVPPSLVSAWLVDVVGRRPIVIPLYLVEIAEDRVRGMLITLFTLMGGTGSFLMMIVGSYLPYFAVTEFIMPWPVVFVAIFWWMPESPYFLVAKHRTEAAKTAVMRLRGKNSEKDVSAELDAIQKAVDDRSKNEISVADAFRALRRDPGARRAVAVTLTFTVLLALNGSAAISAYSTQIFLTSGSTLDASVSAIVLLSVQLFFSIVATLLVDRAGRRPMLLFSFAGCTIAMAVIGVYFYLTEYGSQEVVNSLFWLPLTTLLLYYISFNVGANALLWVLTNELVPSSVRGLCNSTFSVLNSVLTFSITKLFQVVGDSLGSFVPFWFFSVFCLLGLIFTWFFIPETKGRSLEDIKEEMDTKAAGTKESAEKA